jgi:hypothetical protein
MSDDLAKQAIAELGDIVRCRCHPAYKDRKLHDPDCNCDSAEALKVVADRIKTLEAKLHKFALLVFEYSNDHHLVVAAETLLDKTRKVKPDGN